MTGEMLEMPLGGIMISKPRNLKGKSRNITDGYDRALPFHVITRNYNQIIYNHNFF